MTQDDPQEIFLDHYHQNKDKVFNYLMYRLNFDREICEDLLMDIVLKAYKKFETFTPQKASFKSWLFTIAHNHLLNHWRDKKAFISLEFIEENGKELPFTQIKEETAKHFNEKNINTVFSLMNERDREMIVMHYINDLNYGEIAKIMKKKEGAVRTSLSRALNRFKILYNKLYEEK